MPAAMSYRAGTVPGYPGPLAKAHLEGVELLEPWKPAQLTYRPGAVQYCKVR